jgi:hypothetical protein
MPSTLAADRLEYVIAEMRDAIGDIERRAADWRGSPGDLNEALLQALKTARKLLEDAQDGAEQEGVPRLAVFGG